MIIILISFVLMSSIFLVLGYSFAYHFDRSNHLNYSFFESCFLGLATSSAILMIWSIFLPTNIFSLLFLIVLASILIFINRTLFIKYIQRHYKWLETHKMFIVIALIAIICVLLYGMVTPKLYDSLLYHISAIQWNEKYRAIIGLANFNDRLGFNSAIFVLSASFLLDSVYGQYIFSVNSFCVLIFMLYLLKTIYYKKGVFGVFCLLYLYYFINQYAFDISSPGADVLPNIIAAFLLINLLLDFNSIRSKSLIYIILPLFCITLKIAMLPILLLTLYALFSPQNTTMMSLKKGVLYGLFFMFPWLVRNVILTGYSVYPMESLDIFNFDWKVPAERLLLTKNWIYSWGRIPMEDYQKVLAMPLEKWFPIWWENQLPKNRYFFALAVISPFFYLIGIFVNRSKRNFLIPLLVLIISFAALILWLNAPDIRFIFGFILILALYPILIFESIAFKLRKVLNPILMLATIFCLFLMISDGFKVFNMDYRRADFIDYAYYPADPSNVKVKRKIAYNKVHAESSNQDQKFLYYMPRVPSEPCYDQFPCSPTFLNFKIQMRGQSIEDGFITDLK